MRKNANNHAGYNELYNETSNTEAGINTPKSNEGSSPLDMVSDAVAEIVDNIQHTFDGNKDNTAEKK